MNSNNILLFGLSADMPHYGHIRWIATLKAALPEHKIVVMPCGVNPLGKTSKSGDMIYPSNGFLRWHMLFEYYQEFDPEIIVSQYEVAINTPSKTIDTLQYLLHTTITEIQTQRGFRLPATNNSHKINNVSIAVGTDLINQLSNWHAWEDILNNAKLIIMQRAGYKLADIQINDQKLKDRIMAGRKNGTIQELAGPQIAISSRELKNMLQNGASDAELQKYIPEKILTFIRSKRSEFSAEYYQNPSARDTFQKAMTIYKNAVSTFDNKRQRELSAFIYDLIPLGKLDKLSDAGYKLDYGRLIINLQQINNQKLQKTLDNWMQQLNCAWFQKHQKTEKIINPHDFNANFKLLGKYGPNLAIDIIMFVKDKNTNNLQILSINRNDDKRSIAIPGGFYQGTVLKTAVNEFLEECCSNSLFTANSLSIQLIAKNYQKQSKLLITKISKVLNKNLANFQLSLPAKANPLTIIKTAINALHQHLETSNQATQLIAKIKCELYQELLPIQLQTLQKFFKSQGKISNQELCITDQRNTNYAWLVSKVIRFMLKKSDFQQLLTKCGLEISGGDDAATAKLVDINEFGFNQKTFSFHQYLILRTLAKFQEE